MISRLLIVIVCCAGLVAAAAALQQYAPPAPTRPDEDTRKTIDRRIDQLDDKLGRLRALGVNPFLIADAEVYLKAARWITRFDEFYDKDAGKWTLEALDNGLLRASQLARDEKPWLYTPGRSVVRGYRSSIDGSIQPYAVTLPADYGKDVHKRWPIEVVLHGRYPRLTEVSFLHSHSTLKPAPKDQDWIQIDVYGRGNNGYRWAGEMDVFEAVKNFTNMEMLLVRGNLLDPTRIVLRGFSMGGAGTWSLGLHHPTDWCAISPGAGFTTTHGYVKGLPAKLPPVQEACLTIYDAVDWAENAFDVPVVAYGGADDPQLQAARNIEAKLKPLGIPMKLIVAPKLGHRFPSEWQKKVRATYAEYLSKGKTEYPDRVRFVTYTLRYPVSDWVEVLALDQHYRRALVDAKRDGDDGFTIKTENVRGLHLLLWPGATRQKLAIAIDGQKLEDRPYTALNNELHLYLERHEGRWEVVLPERLITERLRHPQKSVGLQGPIDDAFMSAFLCVRGTGRPWHEASQKYADANLERFTNEWARYLRGDLQIKDDVDVSAKDMANNHLILFGDPSSNSLIGQALSSLPIKWTKEKIVWEGQEYAAKDHVPVLIYPSPFSTSHYVVLNSGHTFHADAFQGTNALLYPRLGDHALLKIRPTDKDPVGADVVSSGLFDEYWHMKGRP
jgi:predicted esterase